MFQRDLWLPAAVFSILFHFSWGILATSQDVCSLESCKTADAASQDFKDKCNTTIELRLQGHCCVNLSSDAVIGIDLSYCGLTNIKSIFHEMTDIVRMNLTHNEDLSFTNTSFVGLKKLRTLVLDSNIDCPGNWSWFNSTWQAWNHTEFNEHSKKCINQSNTCEQLKDYNFTCPEHSTCSNNGPGSFLCHCNPGWGGYRCMRKIGYKLEIPILSGVAGATLLASGFLWYTQRRHVL